MGYIGRLIQIIFVGFIISFYYYPVSFSFAPNLVTKTMLAVVGMIVAAINVMIYREYSTNKGMMGALVMATIYSVVNAVIVWYHNETDFSYAMYAISAMVWLFSSYGAMTLIKRVHNEITIELATRYLAGVTVFHCILSQVIDRVDAVKALVKKIFYIAPFYEEVDRLYSFGVALDPAGVRFAIVLVFIASVIAINDKVRNSAGLIAYYIISLIIIIGLGNIISRTTVVGAAFALLIVIFSSGIHRFIIRVNKIKTFRILGLLLAITIPIFIYLFNTNKDFEDQIRYGFEGFFSLVETGEFQTDSTDELDTMWVWPEDTQTWIIGKGVFDTYSKGLYFSDIGYCRFIFYTGITGFSLFVLFFIYNTYVFWDIYPRYRYIFMIVLAMCFIIWAKVATDLFFFFALLYSFVDEGEINPKFRKRQESKALVLG